MCYNNCPNWDKWQDMCRGGECPPVQQGESAATNGEAYRQQALLAALNAINKGKQVAV